MDRVILAGIRCRLRIGVSEAERAAPQDCLVDLEFEQDLSRAMQTDQLRDAVDYECAFNIVQRLAADEKFALLEGFAGRLEHELRRELRVQSITLRVKKLRPPLSGSLEYAGIEICRNMGAADAAAGREEARADRC